MRITATARRAGRLCACLGRCRSATSTAQRLSQPVPADGLFRLALGRDHERKTREIEDMLRIALPNKGRLADETRELFGDAGLDIRARGDRALTASLGGEFEALFVRAQDIPEFVADGAADAGVTGWDLVCESGRSLDTLLDLEFGRCRMVVAAREGIGISSIDDLRGTSRVATVFPRLTKKFFECRGLSVEVVPMSGAAEIAPHLGIAD